MFKLYYVMHGKISQKFSEEGWGHKLWIALNIGPFVVQYSLLAVVFDTAHLVQFMIELHAAEILSLISHM